LANSVVGYSRTAAYKCAVSAPVAQFIAPRRHACAAPRRHACAAELGRGRRSRGPVTRAVGGDDPPRAPQRCARARRDRGVPDARRSPRQPARSRAGGLRPAPRRAELRGVGDRPRLVGVFGVSLSRGIRANAAPHPAYTRRAVVGITPTSSWTSGSRDERAARAGPIAGVLTLVRDLHSLEKR